MHPDASHHRLQLPAMRRPPRYVVLENVEGFFGGLVHSLFRKALQPDERFPDQEALADPIRIGERRPLSGTRWHLKEFVCSPHQLGVPYLRARYFALATRQTPDRGASASVESEARASGDGASPAAVGSTSSAALLIRHPPELPEVIRERLFSCSSRVGRAGRRQSVTDPVSIILGEEQKMAWPECCPSGTDNIRQVTRSCLPLGRFLEDGTTSAALHTSQSAAGVDKDEEASEMALWDRHRVPDHLLARYWMAYGEAESRWNCLATLEPPLCNMPLSPPCCFVQTS